jgi:hypothetical protein
VTKKDEKRRIRMQELITNKPRYKPQGRNVRFRRSKALAKRRLLTAIRDFRACGDTTEQSSREAARKSSADNAQSKED